MPASDGDPRRPPSIAPGVGFGRSWRRRGAAGSSAPALSEAAIGIKLVISTLLLLVAVGGYAGYSQMRFNELNEMLAADIATYQRQRWVRPVLRGEVLEGNAAEEVLAQLAHLPRLTAGQRDAIAQHLYRAEPLSEPLKALISEHRVVLARLRAATRHAWSMNVLDLRRGSAMSVPDYPKVMDAALMLLSTGLSYDPQGCLQLGADAMRLGQDLVPGAPLEAASVAMRIASVATPLITACAARADEQALRRAAAELHNLATHPPPVGVGIELADVVARVELHAQGELFAEGESPLRRLGKRPGLFEQWSYLDDPTRWRELSPSAYPAALDTWKREYDFRSRSARPEVAAAAAGVLGFLYDDMRGQALLRAMTVGLSTLAERQRRGRMPPEPSSLRDPALCDPYTGEPLSWRVSQDGEELALWSVGEDLRDDKGSGDWSTQAPVDVVVRFALRPQPAAEEKRSQRGKRRARAR